ncbi:MAG: hypothetical protein WAK93_03375 [Solirubrobacteraceae bacterium]
MATAPDLDQWLAKPTLRVHHRRPSQAPPDQLWEAATSVRLSETARLGRLVRWRIPGLGTDETFDRLFREPPFLVLEEGEHCLVSGLVGRIWTLRRDYPSLDSPQEFTEWGRRGTSKVAFATWIESDANGGAALCNEARVEAIGAQGRVGVAAVKPIVRAFQGLVASEGIAAAVRRAESG